MRNKTTIFVIAALLGCGLFFFRQTTAATSTPTQLSYQGQLIDGSGLPLLGTLPTLHFEMFETEIGGAALWSETHQNVPLDDDGRFTVQVGSVNTSGLDTLFADHAELWLEITIGSDTLSPRQRVNSVGYALRANSVDWSGLTGIPAEILDGDQYLLPFIGLESSGALNNFVSIQEPFRLPQGCGDEQIARWEDASDVWVCGDDESGQTTVYAAGSGLRLINNGTTFEAAFQGVGGSLGTSNFVSRGDHTHAGQDWFTQTNNGLSVTTQEDEAGSAGLLGVAQQGATFGVEGRAQGEANGAAGVRGSADSDAHINYGVYGSTNSPTGYGVYSDGNAHVAGDFTTSGRISVGGSLNMPYQGVVNNALPHSHFSSIMCEASVIIGSDGMPVIAYREQVWEGEPLDVIKVAKCHDPACEFLSGVTVDDTIGFIDTSSNTAHLARPNIAIDGQGLPIVAYLTADRSIRVAFCKTMDCSVSVVQTLVSSSEYDNLSSDTLALAAFEGGFVVVFYQRVVPERLMMVRCYGDECEDKTVGVVQEADESSIFGWQAQAVIGADTSVLIVFYGSDGLYAAYCPLGTCIGGDGVTLTLVSAECALCGNRHNYNPMVAIGRSGLPLIVYRGGADSIETTQCLKLDCTIRSRAESIPIQFADPNGYIPSILVMDSTGLASFMLRTGTNPTNSANTRLYTCVDAACTNLFERDMVAQTILPPVMTFGMDDNPILVYYRDTVLHCGDRFCSGATRRR